MVGLAGGIAYVPLLYFVFKVEMSYAIFISMFVMMFTYFTSMLGFISKQNVDYKQGFIGIAFNIPAIILGTFISQHLSNIILKFFAGFIISILGFSILLKNLNYTTKSKFPTVKTNKSKIEMIFFIMMNLFSGFLTGMIGLGGGSVISSSLILIGYSPVFAAGTSTFISFFANFTATITRVYFRELILDFAIPMAITGSIMGFIGGKICHKINGKIIKQIIGFYALITGLRLFI